MISLIMLTDWVWSKDISLYAYKSSYRRSLLSCRFDYLLWRCRTLRVLISVAFLFLRVLTLAALTSKSFEDLLLEVLSSHKKEVVLRWALKEDWLYGIGCVLSHKNSKHLISCCMIAFLSFWDWGTSWDGLASSWSQDLIYSAYLKSDKYQVLHEVSIRC